MHFLFPTLVGNGLLFKTGALEWHDRNMFVLWLGNHKFESDAEVAVTQERKLAAISLYTFVPVNHSN